MKQYLNRKGSLSPVELELRDRVVEAVTHRHSQRLKLANLRSLLKPTPIPTSQLAKLRPVIAPNIGTRDKVFQDRVSHALQKKPEALQALRSFRKIKMANVDGIATEGGEGDTDQITLPRTSCDHVYSSVPSEAYDQQYPHT